MSSQPRDTRTKILDASWKILESQGPQDVRMRDIAQAAGVSRQTLYLYFGNRAELLEATRKHIDLSYDFDARLATVLAADTAGGMLHGYVDLWAGYLPQIRGVAGSLLAARASDAAAAAAWGACMGDHRRVCDQIVERLSAEQKLSARWDKAAAAELLWSLLSFQFWQLLSGECHWSDSRFAQQMKAVVDAVLIDDTD